MPDSGSPEAFSEHAAKDPELSLWYKGLSQDYKLRTASFDPTKRLQWIFRGYDKITVGALRACNDVQELGLLFASIDGVGDFLTQHLLWNFLELNVARPRVQVDVPLLAPAHFDFVDLTR